MTLDELKELELPVELVYKHDDNDRFKTITISAFNNMGFLFKDSYGEDGYFSINAIKDFKPKPKTVKVHFWLNIYKDFVARHGTKEEADKRAYLNRLACEEFIREYEIE